MNKSERLRRSCLKSVREIRQVCHHKGQVQEIFQGQRLSHEDVPSQGLRANHQLSGCCNSCVTDRDTDAEERKQFPSLSEGEAVQRNAPVEGSCAGLTAS